MILQSLCELYDRLKDDARYQLAKPGFSPQKISFRVVLRTDGTLFDIQDARVKNEKGKLLSDIMLVPGEAKPSGAGVNPCFLWDNQTYMLGRQPEEKADGFGLERFEAFKTKHLELEKVIDSRRFSIACRFLELWNPEQVEEHSILEELATGFGVFQVQGETGYVHSDSKVLEWWESQSASKSEKDGQCLITGKPSTIARLHPKIKGVANAQAAGASIVSYNDNAYESYGKTQSYNGPVGEDAAFKYGTALNSLLGGPMSKKHRIKIGDSTCVFWTDKPSITENIFAQFVSDGSKIQDEEETQDEELRLKMEAFLKAVQKGKTAYREIGDDVDQTMFFILGLAPNAARLSVRFFYRATLGELLDNLNKHFDDLQIVRQFDVQVGKRLPDPVCPANWQLLKETARVSDEIPPLLGGSLMRAILEGTPYPEGLYTAVIRRIHLDRTVNYFRAGIIKAILQRNHKIQIPIMLNKSTTEISYLLGRLFAVLEKTQEDSGNKGVRERFYSSASATPATVFPRLLRTYPHHLVKLSEGAKINREKLMQEILDSVTEFPPQFNLHAQGQFALGYYHQKKDFYTKKDEHADSDSAE